MVDSLSNNNDCIGEDFVVSKYQRYLIAKNRSTLTGTLFSGDSSAWDISKINAVQDADVINFHWVSEFLNSESLQLISNLGKPLVWTLHDESAYTGGCHYTFGCKNYSESCSSCPQVINKLSWLPEFNLKARSKLKTIPISFVCPSNWIQSKLLSSKVFNKNLHRSHVIPNSINLSTFKPLETSLIGSIKKELGIEKDSICILFGSFSLEDDRKGTELILNSLKKLKELLKTRKLFSKIVILSYGKGSLPINSYDARHCGFLNNDEEIARILNIADLFISMTREDNLPNTIMESLACGTPVISSDVGGISDMVENGHNGLLIERDNTMEMAQSILYAMLNKSELTNWSLNARKTAEQKYSHKKQGSEYLKVFSKLLEDNSFGEKTGLKKTIGKVPKRISALNSFPSKKYKTKALNWFKKYSNNEG
tara:strand:- start:540 stop:1814 length:1275 start_codon:yes stop_codon:yes gene_type:complete